MFTNTTFDIQPLHSISGFKQPGQMKHCTLQVAIPPPVDSNLSVDPSGQSVSRRGMNGANSYINYAIEERKGKEEDWQECLTLALVAYMIHCCAVT